MENDYMQAFSKYLNGGGDNLAAGGYSAAPQSDIQELYNMGNTDNTFGMSGGFQPDKLDAGGGMFGEIFNKDNMSMMGDLAGAGKGIFDIYSGYKNLGMMEDMMDYSKATNNRNLANNAAATNLNVDAIVANRAYGKGLTGQAYDSAIQQGKQYRADGSPIKT